MNYQSVRILIVAALAIISFLIIEKKVNVKRRKTIYKIFSGIYIALFIISFLFPYERQFIRFDSPREAYCYSVVCGNLVKIIQDKNLAVAIYTNNNNNTSFAVFDKDDRGWLMSNINQEPIDLKVFDTYNVTIASGSNKKIVIVDSLTSDIYNNQIEIKDSCGSQFNEFDNLHGGIKCHYYYAIVSGVNNNYKMIINGKTITVYSSASI